MWGKNKGPVNRIVIIALLLVVMLLSGAGAIVVYDILFPAIWDEPLPFKNSTGQYQMVTNYRNATDVTHENLTKFIASKDLEQMINSDPEYRCVEYAAYLHNEAEAGGINCSIIGTGLKGEVPDHAVNVFYTTDRGLVYVDCSSKNVSQQDYSSLPIEKIVFTRNKWTEKLPFMNGNYQYLKVTEYRNATDITYDELVRFLMSDDTEWKQYDDPVYTCADFAVTLHDRAESQGIKCAVVSVRLKDQIDGHAFNAFPTTDRGVVFIDCTGINATQSGKGFMPHDNVVFLETGKYLGELPLEQTESLDYAYFEQKKQRHEEYMKKWEQYNGDMDRYNSDVDSYNKKVNQINKEWSDYGRDFDEYKEKLSEYNDRMKAHNDAVLKYNEGYDVDIPPVPQGGEELDAWRDRLISQYDSLEGKSNALDRERSSLNMRQKELESRRLSLINSEEYKWITYYPLGIVESVRVVW